MRADGDGDLYASWRSDAAALLVADPLPVGPQGVLLSSADPAPSAISGSHANGGVWPWIAGSSLDWQTVHMAVHPGVGFGRGDEIRFGVEVRHGGVDGTVGVRAELLATITNSWDPNDMLVSPEGDIDPGQLLIYVIRVENVGDADAIDVRIDDVLAPELDEASLALRPVDRGSFDMATRAVHWDLRGVHLPPHHSGFVTFQVTARPDLAPGTRIDNHARIVFDSNPAIDTPVVEDVIRETPPPA
jgi:hypothetical protein